VSAVQSAALRSAAQRDCAALDLEDDGFAIGKAASDAGDAGLEEARVRVVLPADDSGGIVVVRNLGVSC
jgi:hypothetical protein